MRNPYSLPGAAQLTIIALMFGLALAGDAIGLPRGLATAAGIVLAGLLLGVWAGLAGRRGD